MPEVTQDTVAYFRLTVSDGVNPTVTFEFEDLAVGNGATAGNSVIANYLLISYIPGVGELTIISYINYTSIHFICKKDSLNDFYEFFINFHKIT